MVAKSIAKMYTNIHKPTDYCLSKTEISVFIVLSFKSTTQWHLAGD